MERGMDEGTVERLVAAAVAVALVAVAAGVAVWRTSEPAEVATLVVESPGAVLERHGYRLVRVVPGTFLQGAGETDPDRMQDEIRRAVELTRPFSIGATEVTGALYADVMGADPSSRTCDGCPVTDVSWLDAARFCNRLSLREGLRPVYTLDGEAVHWSQTATGYRLPTEAEWEFAAHGGRDLRFAGGDEPEAVAWFADNAGEAPQPVGRKRPNPLGLYDMSGNVWEWVWDRYGVWTSSTVVDPLGADEGDLRVGKGGAWNTWGDMVRVAARSRGGPTSRGDVLGFRIARTTD